MIELAGDAANGARRATSASRPMRRSRRSRRSASKFQKEYKYKRDHNGIKGYSAMYIVKAMTEKIGKVDPKAFAKALHGAKITPSRTIPACCST